MSTTPTAPSPGGGGPPLPAAPTVNPTQVASWMNLKHEDAASAAEKVLLNNQRVLAVQNQHIMQAQETILDMMSSVVRKRGSSIASSVSGVSGEEGVAEDNRPAQEAMKALTGEEWFETVYSHYVDFITTGKKKVYVRRNVSATQDAGDFTDDLTAFMKETDENHPMLPHLNALNIDLKVVLYAKCGKKMKDAEKEAKAKGKDKAGTSSGKGKKASGAAQRKKGTSRRVIDEDEDEEDEEDEDDTGSQRAAALTTTPGGGKRKRTARAGDDPENPVLFSSPSQGTRKRTRFTASTHGGSSPVPEQLQQDDDDDDMGED